MKRLWIRLALPSVPVVLATTLAGCPGAGGPALISAEFIGMAPPATVEQKSDVYTSAGVRLNYSDGTSKVHDLEYRTLFDTTDDLDGSIVGGLFDGADRALRDRDGPLASDAPDGTSLMKIDGLVVPGATGNPLAMVTQFEYRELPPNDAGTTGTFRGRLPAAIGLTLLDQDPRDGLLTARSYRNISLKDAKGGWIHCGSTLSAWNTHIGSEEYEPDAKTRAGLIESPDSGDSTDIAGFSRCYFGDPAAANPYHYGLVPEITVAGDGRATVVKHHAPGRFSREMMEMAADRRTGIGGDDGVHTGLFMFVADRAGDLSAGTIYAAAVSQIGAHDGGAFDLRWIRLGHAGDAEIKALVDGGITFSDIFLVSNTDPKDDTYARVKTHTGTEWLKLKSGMETAAAFLETRRYAALQGATTEFSKMEYIAFNGKDRKFYVTISRIEEGMADDAGDIRLGRNDGGGIYEMSTASGRKDSAGAVIDSAYVGTRLVSIPALLGGWEGKADAEGNQCAQDRICGPDNIRFVESIRTLLIGEDTGRRNNNYVWAFNVDTRQLARILAVPMNAEATGLMVVEDYNGHAYIMSNFQHPGEGLLPAYTGGDKAEVVAAIDRKWAGRKKAAIGYIGVRGAGALPALR